SPTFEDNLSLPAVRTRIRQLQNQVQALKRVPIPAPNIQAKVQAYVEQLPMPSIGGIAADEALTVQWPTGLHALMAFLQPDVLVERLMVEIDRLTNTPCALPQREQQIVTLEDEIDRLQRTQEAIVVSTGAAREPECPPWIVLGAKVVPSASGRRSGD